MKKEIQDAINNQIKEETFSAYLYLSMAAYFERENLAGAATWMKSQAQEEMVHSMKFFDFLNQKGGVVKLQAIPQPDHDFKSIVDVFEQALEHEKFITSKINDLYDLAAKEGDRSFQVFLNWFVEEQDEEEDTVNQILGKLDGLDLKSKHAVLMIDSELGQRPLIANMPTEGGGE
jgi:ferritin